MIDQGGVEIHDQALAGGHAGRFLDGLPLDRHLVVGFQGIDQK